MLSARKHWSPDNLLYKSCQNIWKITIYKILDFDNISIQTCERVLRFFFLLTALHLQRMDLIEREKWSLSFWTEIKQFVLTESNGAWTKLLLGLLVELHHFCVWYNEFLLNFWLRSYFIIYISHFCWPQYYYILCDAYFHYFVNFRYYGRHRNKSSSSELDLSDSEDKTDKTSDKLSNK